MEELPIHAPVPSAEGIVTDAAEPATTSTPASLAANDQAKRIAEKLRAQKGAASSESAKPEVPEKAAPEEKTTSTTDSEIVVAVDHTPKGPMAKIMGKMPWKKKDAGHGHGHGGGGHGHGAHAEAGPIACCLSGIVCGLLMFVFACVFAEMIFGATLPDAVPIGVGQQTLTIMVGGLIFSKFSGCKAVVAGPDINPVVFLAEAATAVTDTVCTAADGSGSSSGSLDGSGSASGSLMASHHRMLAGGAPPECPDSAVPTVLVFTAIATLLVGIMFFCLGHFKLTEVVGYIPAPVVGGFLSCIGIKVLKYSVIVAIPLNKKLKFKYVFEDPQFFVTWQEYFMFYIPAFPIGCILYYLKRKHIGDPAVYFPVMILVPTFVFYMIVLGQGNSMEDMVEQGWLFPKVAENEFWNQFSIMYGGLQDGIIEWSALSSAFPSWIVMLLIVALDNMLKLASTESSMGIDFDYNAEMKVGGFATVVTALMGGSPAYSQTKFNVLNNAMTHSTTKRLGPIVCALFNGVWFFSGYPVRNFLPRFVLSALLVFASVGFLIENLWDARLKFNKMNFFTIWVIFILNIIAGELAPSHALLIAIIAGLMLGLVSFAIHFARKSSKMSSSKTVIISGEETCSTAIRSAGQEAKLGVLGVWYSTMHPSGYIFFGTAARLHRIMKVHVEEMNLRAYAERTKLFILDLTDVYGIDVSASLIFVKIIRLCKANGINLVWSGMKGSVLHNLTRAGVIKATAPNLYEDLDSAQKFVEDELLKHVHNLSAKWLVDKRCRNIYNRAMLHDALNNNCAASGEGIAPTQLLRWSARSYVHTGENVLVEGKADDGLYLLYRGAIRADHCSAEIEAHTIYPGAYFNEHVLYSPPETGALYTAHAEEDSVILRLSHEQRQTMLHNAPHHMYQLMIAVFKQVEMRNPQRRRHTWSGKLDAEMGQSITFKDEAELKKETLEAHLDKAAEDEHEEPKEEEPKKPAGWGTIKKSMLGASAAIAIANAAATKEADLAATVSAVSTTPDTADVLEAGEAAAPAGEEPKKPAVVPPNIAGKRRGSCVGSMGSMMAHAASGALAEKEEKALQHRGARRRGSCVGAAQIAAAKAKDDKMHDMLDKANRDARPSKEHHDDGKRRGSVAGNTKRRGSTFGWWAHDDHHDDHHAHAGGRRRSSVSGAAHAVAQFLTGHHDNHSSSPEAHRAHSPDAHHPAPGARRGSTAGGGNRRKSIASQIADVVKLHHPEDHHAHIHHKSDNLNDAEHAPLLADRKAVDHDHYLRHTEVVDAHFIREADFRVPLTAAQTEHYTLIFDLNRDQEDETAVRDRLKVHDLAHFMETLGFPVPEEDLIQMIHDLHITMKDGAVELPAFIEFMRRTLVADLPSSKIPTIHFLFESEAVKNATGTKSVAAKDSPAVRKARASKETIMAVKGRSPRPTKEDEEGVAARAPRASKEEIEKAKAGPKLVKKAQVAYMLEKLGFMLDELTINESFAEVDGDADGQITEPEFLTQLGMLKRNLLEVHQLEKSFMTFRVKAKEMNKKKRDAQALAASLEEKNHKGVKGMLTKRRSSAETSDTEEQDEHALYASDLMAALDVTEQEAEEMVFIADLKESQSIDFNEFKQVVVNWSS